MLAPGPVASRATRETAREPVAAEAGAPEETDEPLLPGDETEAAMLAELRERGETSSNPIPMPADEEPAGRLPPLDDLVKQIPADVRDVLDELFRARFTTVRKVPVHVLKSVP